MAKTKPSDIEKDLKELADKFIEMFKHNPDATVEGTMYLLGEVVSKTLKPDAEVEPVEVNGFVVGIVRIPKGE